ncbi:MAG: Hsp70 family protein, partial [Propioniciclava sp.]
RQAHAGTWAVVDVGATSVRCSRVVDVVDAPSAAATVSIDTVGGSTFDDAVFAHLKSRRPDADEAALMRLRAAAGTAKEALADRSAVTVDGGIAGEAAISLSRGEFDTLIDPALTRAITAVTPVVTEPSPVNGILLVGGSAGVSQLSRRLAETFDITVSSPPDAQNAAARGAARHALHSAPAIRRWPIPVGVTAAALLVSLIALTPLVGSVLPNAGTGVPSPVEASTGSDGVLAAAESGESGPGGTTAFITRVSGFSIEPRPHPVIAQRPPPRVVDGLTVGDYPSAPRAASSPRRTTVTAVRVTAAPTTRPTGTLPRTTDPVPTVSGPEPTGPAPRPEPAAPTSPGPTSPGPADPEPSDPGPTDPSPTEPGPTDPDPTEPSPTEPGPTGPGEPEPTDPGPPEPSPTASADRGPKERGPKDPRPTNQRRPTDPGHRRTNTTT